MAGSGASPFRSHVRYTYTPIALPTTASNAATIDTGVMDFLFVCDQDDPDVASPLLSASMPVDAALEQDG